MNTAVPAVHSMANGFTVVPGVFGAVELDEIVRKLGSASIKRSRAGTRHLLSIPAIASLARDPRLLKLAADALDCDPVPFGATLFDKSAEANWLVVWHQDTALPIRERRDVAGWGPWSEKAGVMYAHAPAAALSHVVALRLHLDDSSIDNGPLRVLPGTHTLGVLSDEEIHAVAKRVEPVVCTAERGGVLVMRPLLVHASSKAAVLTSRRVIHFEYAASVHVDHDLQLRAVGF